MQTASEFIAKTLSANFGIIEYNFTENAADAHRLKMHVANADNWEISETVSPDTETDFYVPSDDYSRSIFGDDYRANRYMDIVGGSVLPLDHIRFVYEMNCKQMEGQLRFVVFETNERFHLGRYVGD